MTRKEKKRQKASRMRQRVERRWHHYATILDAIGLGDGFRALKERIKNMLCAFWLPLPEIISAFPDPIVCQIRDEILNELADVEVSVCSCGAKLPWVDVYRVLVPLVIALKNAVIESGSLTDPEAKFLRHARRVSQERFEDILDATQYVLGNAVLRAVASASQFDLRLVWYEVEKPVFESPQRHGHRIKIAMMQPQRIDPAFDGFTRAAYRCGGDYQTGFRWVIWPGDVLGLGESPQGFEVYIQNHAVERLHHRLKPFDHPTVHFSLLMSLDRPVIQRCEQQDTYLIEYRLADRARVGYLVARRWGDRVIITTFLFLTMQGTPEAERLARHLGLRRADIEYNHLDTLSAFINSNLAQDVELAQVFKRAGCGDLFKFVCDDFLSRPLEAGRLREYLGLVPRPRELGRLLAREQGETLVRKQQKESDDARGQLAERESVSSN